MIIIQWLSLSLSLSLSLPLSFNYPYYYYPYPYYYYYYYYYKVAIQQKKHGKRVEKSELSVGMSFLYENYTDRCWFWEIIELARKIVLTSALFLVDDNSRTYLGASSMMCGLYAILFAYYKPIHDKFEHWLQLLSLASTSATLNVALLLKIPQHELSDSVGQVSDSVGVIVLLVLANTLVTAVAIGMLKPVCQGLRSSSGLGLCSGYRCKAGFEETHALSLV